ncbi:MAG: SusC/RagA family TonB-linked outer membrane protein, partial [Chloroherpetonaceae bacterium]|nr:SusC/RagA family TonB-linked outer membrane protein [Chloroherpetonaceae bacterium]
MKKAILCCITFLCLCVHSYAQQQTQTISGRIIDAETKEGLPGAVVSIPALRIGSSTNANGEYSFRAPIGTHIVEVKLIGYETKSQTVTVTATEPVRLDFALRVKASQAEEVVVLGLSGEVDRSKLGAAVGNVAGERINNIASPAAIDGLSGQVTGIQVTRASGVPGGSTFITVRGPKSARGSSEPVYIVDGVIIDNTQTSPNQPAVDAGARAIDINPQDIESIEVLKGPAAAAIYGAVAGNGVIIINTKKGKYNNLERPTKISAAGFYETASPLGSIDLQKEYGQGINGVAGPNAYREPGPGETRGTPGGAFSWGPRIQPGQPVYDQLNGIFRTPNSWQQTVSISGATSYFDYYVGGTFDQNQGVFRNSDLNRNNFRANVGFTLLPGVRYTTTNNYIVSQTLIPTVGNSISGIYLSALRTPPDFDNTRAYEPDGSQRRYGPYDNPIWTQENNSYTSRLSRFIHNSALTWDIYQNPETGFVANLRAQLGLDRYDQTNTYILARGARDANFGPGGTGAVVSDPRFDNQLNLEIAATLKYNFIKDIKATLVAGGQSISLRRDAINAQTSDISPFFSQLNSGATQLASSSRQEWVIIGQFAQLTLDLFDRIAVTASVRRDGSSAFGTNQPFSFFPKAGFSYNLGQESFMEGLKGIVDNVIIRAAYGESGSPQQPDPYATNFLYTTGGITASFARGTWSNRLGNAGLNASTAGGATQDVRPERLVEREIGLNLGFWNNRINVEANYYMTSVFDIIVSFPVAPSTGYNSVLRNAAAMTNEGFELSIQGTILNTPEVTWNATLNYARFHNIVNSLSGAAPILLGGFAGSAAYINEGQPYGALQVNGWLRDQNGNIVRSGITWVQVDASGNMVRQGGRVISVAPNAPNSRLVVAGAFTANDVANNGAITGLVGAPVQDGQPIFGFANPWPAYTLSLRNDFRIFKNLSISILFDGVFGNRVFNGTQGGMIRFGTWG